MNYTYQNCKDFITFEVRVCSLYDRLFIALTAFFFRTKILETVLQ